ncbi:MAG: FAD-dependent oxidoreductase [Nitrospirae bacterium]|nr:FAD-dependent oxidoreductase [Nitrospirota bacterium]
MAIKELKKEIKTIDAEWLKVNIPCQHACPIETDVSGYVGAIAEGDFLKAYAINREVNPFISICGRVCAAPCQDNCRRGKLIDEPISIRALKRFVADYARGNDYKEKLAVAPSKGKKVAIIGAGPAGLSAADHLARMGYSVTIFESQKIPGGMMYLGIPEYRLPRDIIKSEIDMILSMGAELKCNMAAGRDFTISDLQKEYDAIFIAIGAHKSRDLRIEGVDLDGVLRGVDFLLNANLGYKVDMGKRVLVVGGGNVAIDVARVAVRKKKEKIGAAEDITTAIDIARAAVRMGEVEEVHMVCLESREEMPAHEEEVGEAINEGIIIHNSLGPKRIVGKKGVATGLEALKVKSVFDDKGRFNPTFIEGSESVIEADTIVMAIGQTSDLSWIKPKDGIEVTPRNIVVVDPDTLASLLTDI